MKSRLFVVVVELTGAIWITYQQLPEDHRQRVRMHLYQHGAHVCRMIAHRAGALGIQLEHRYAEEVSGNG